MYGLEAITEARGWQMAALGVTIVFASLIILSILISQLHNFLEVWEKRKTLFQDGDASTVPTAPQPATADSTLLPHPAVCPDDINAVAAIWAPLIDQLEEPFTLAELYKSAAANQFPHPHLTINRLREAGILVPADNGRFAWKQA